MGHVVEMEGLQPDQKIGRAVMDIPRPEDGTRERPVLGLVRYYCPLVLHFSPVAAPLFKTQSSGANLD